MGHVHACAGVCVCGGVLGKHTLEGSRALDVIKSKSNPSFVF